MLVRTACITCNGALLAWAGMRCRWLNKLVRQLVTSFQSGWGASSGTDGSGPRTGGMKGLRETKEREKKRGHMRAMKKEQ